MSPRSERLTLVGELGRILVKADALRFGTFTLADGKASAYYIDLHVVPSFPSLFSRVVEAFVEALRKRIGVEKIDAIWGVPIVGLTYASVVAHGLRKPLIYARKEAVGFRMIEGLMTPGMNVVILDDLIATGQSIRSSAGLIRAEGGRVSDAVVLIDREEGGVESLAEEGVQVYALSKISELVDHLYDLQVVDEDVRMAVRQQVEETSRS